MSESSDMGTSSHAWKSTFERPEYILLALTLVGLVVRLLVLPHRWIGPDEGSYLMDARLILDGKVPVADYAARQPVFLYGMALVFKLFGTSLTVGRLVPLFCNLGIVWLVYFLAKRIFDSEVALFGATTFLFLPFSIIWSLTVLTEMPAILLACGSVYALLLATKNSGTTRYYFLSGASASFAFYIRQTAVWIPATAFLYLVIADMPNTKARLKGLLVFVTGYLVVCAGVVLYYVNFLSAREVLFSRLNPFDIIVAKLFPVAYSNWSGVTILPESIQRPDVTEGYLRTVVSIGLFAFIGAGIATALQIRDKRTRTGHIEDYKGAGLLGMWAGTVLVMYAYRAVERGLYGHYLLEILPPLIILYSFAIVRLLKFREADQRRGPILGGVLILYLGVYAIQHKFWNMYLGNEVYLAVGILFTGVIWFWRPSIDMQGAKWFVPVLALSALAFILPRLSTRVGMSSSLGILLFFVILAVLSVALEKRGPFGARKHPVPFLAFALLAFALTHSAGKAGRILGPTYGGVWSPESLRTVKEYLRNNGSPGDEVLSGAMIWTFEAGMNCFGGVTHPMAFLSTERATLEEAFEIDPPEFVVFDGYTRRHFDPHCGLLRKQITELYEELGTVQGSRYPISVFRLHSRSLTRREVWSHGKGPDAHMGN